MGLEHFKSLKSQKAMLLVSEMYIFISNMIKYAIYIITICLFLFIIGYKTQSTKMWDLWACTTSAA